MAKAFLKSRKYSNNFRAEQSSFLIGNVGDKITLELEFAIEIKFLSSFSEVAEVTTNDTLTRSSGSWYDDGFIEGGNVTIVSDNGTTVNTTTATIQTLTPSTMILTSLAGDVIVDGSYPDAANSFGNIRVLSDTSIEGIELVYNLMTNTDSQGGGVNTSLIDGTVPTYKRSGIDATDLSTKFLTAYNYVSGAAIDNVSIKGLGIAGGIQSFQVNIEFWIAPFYETTTDLTGSTVPSFFDDVECVTDFIYCKFLPQPSNPNIFVEVDTSQTNLLGNTGFFNENFNGGVNNFTVDAFNLTSSASIPVTTIQTKEPTSFELIFTHVGNTTDSEYKLGWCWAPTDISLISNKKYEYNRNVMYCGAGDGNPLKENGFTTGTYVGEPEQFGGAMNIRVDSISRISDQVIIKGAFEPNTAFGTFMDALGGVNLNYLFWVSVADETLATLSSDRVSLLVSYGDLSTSSINVEAFDVTNSFLSHAQTSNQLGVSNIESCVEDEITARGLILIDTALNESINDIDFVIEGANQVTQVRYTLESNIYDCTQYPKDNAGIQQINVNDRRGFKMAAGVEKNEVKVFRSPIDDTGTKVAYKYLYSFRPRWEDWIVNTNVPSNFYDATKLNNNFNDDWAAKEDLANWVLQFGVRMTVDRGGTTIFTRNSFDFTVNTYEESNVWDGAITTYNETKTNSLFVGLDANNVRQNGIASQTNTWIEADFDLEDLLADVGDINDYYGVIRIEEYRNGGIFAIDMLSTILDNEASNNILVPLTGESKCKITKVSLTKIRLECFIDYTKLNTSVANYKISARIGKKDINLGKYSSHYSIKYN